VLVGRAGDGPGARGARLLDLLPVFSTPIARAFSGSLPVPSSFFFMNLFLHVAAPLGLAAMLAVHVARLARRRSCRRAALPG
jgi:hypothetical protein